MIILSFIMSKTAKFPPKIFLKVKVIFNFRPPQIPRFSLKRSCYTQYVISDTGLTESEIWYKEINHVNRTM